MSEMLLSRRAFIPAAAVAGLVSVPKDAFAQFTYGREPVAFSSAGIPTGSIAISQRQRRLYFVMNDGNAMSYPVAIGKTGKAWSGWTRVTGKYVNPDWVAPEVVVHDNPRIPRMIPGGTPGNPMGMRAMTLELDEIAIHGTTISMRKSIGSAASYGCIRMLNEDVCDLFDRVSVGTPVVSIA